MATFVLIAGAWHGGWAWRKLAALLRREGHDVYTPTLTGVGDRAHLLTRATSLETHVQDVLSLLEYEDLTDVTLVGHSYAGMVATGAAYRAPDRVAHLAYLDAWFPCGEARSLEQVARRHLPGFWSHLEEMVRTGGDGWLLPIPPVENPYNLPDAEEARWMKARLTPHPWRTFLDPLPQPTLAAVAIPRTYIACPESTGFAPLAPLAELARQQGWRTQEIPAGHACMFTAPERLSDLLCGLADKEHASA